MTTTILCIRHGQTDWNLAGRWQGQTDIPLNETGRGQARALGKRLADWPIKAIYASDLQRALETARLIAEPHAIEVSTDQRLRERTFGLLEGMTRDEILTELDKPMAELNRLFANPPEGESFVTAGKRVVAAYEAIVAQHQDEMVAIVTHGGLLGALAAYVLGLPAGQTANVSFRNNTGLSIIEIEPHRQRFVLLNDARHLE